MDPPETAAPVAPLTVMVMTMPAALWPATVHQASVLASKGPTSTVWELLGASILVPSVPSTFRSWSMVPLLVTFRMSFWLGSTSMVAGSTLNSVRTTDTVLGGLGAGRSAGPTASGG
ncbi:MAG: hypothetical protein R2698_12910 [Microthrixaceae bacterium]